MPSVRKNRLTTNVIKAAAIGFGLSVGFANALVSTPPSAAVDPAPAASSFASSDLVDVTAGSFRVNEAGAATYSIPIGVPAGTAGVAPQISLNYNSQAGNGIAGVGWSLSAESSISRCRQTLYQDGVMTPIRFTSLDRFCLNGQRLILTSGSSYGAIGATYKFEIDNGSYVISHGGWVGNPDYFELHSKDGSITTFGNQYGQNETSEVYGRYDGGGLSAEVMTWKQRRFTDSVGNFIRYRYTDDADGHVLRDISYAYGGASSQHNYNAIIEFAYDLRSPRNEEMTSTYVKGYRFQQKKRLSRITVRNRKSGQGSFQDVRVYHLRYLARTEEKPQSRLDYVEECLGSVCKKKTKFTWNDRTPGYFTYAHTSELLQSGNRHDQVKQTRFADINGDGLMDLIFHRSDYDGQKISEQWWEYALMVKGDTSIGEPEVSLGNVHQIHYTTNDIGEDPYGWAVNDFDSDGNADVFIPDDNGNLLMYRSNGSGFQAASDTQVDLHAGNILQFSDVNGDGLADLVYRYQDVAAGDTGLKVYVREVVRNYDSGLQKWVSEFSSTANSLESMLVQEPVDPQTGLGFKLEEFEDFVPAGDFNGDGKMDFIVKRSVDVCPANQDCDDTQHLAVVTSDTTNTQYSLYDVLVDPAVLALPVTNLLEEIDNFVEEESNYIHVADFNGDGLSDVIIGHSEHHQTNVHNGTVTTTNQYWSVYLNTGEGFKLIQHFGNPNATAETISGIHGYASMSLTDFNGDGTLDLVRRAGGQLIYNVFDRITEQFLPDRNVTSAMLSSSTNIHLFQYFVDVNADGTPDYIGEHDRYIYIHTADWTANRIDEIDNGLGGITKIEYMPMTDDGIYTRSTDAADFSWNLPGFTQSLGKSADEPIFEFTSTQYLVSKVSTISPEAGATGSAAVDNDHYSSIHYLYGGSKWAAGGRGNLGFAEVWSLDGQNALFTVTKYRQDFPFIGMPFLTETSTLDSNGQKLIVKSSLTYWSLEDWAHSNQRVSAPFPVFQDYTVDVTYDLETGNELTRVDTDTNMNDWLNVTSSTVTTYEAGDLANWIGKVETTNYYTPPGLSATYAQEKGRLSSSKVFHRHPDDTSTPNPFDSQVNVLNKKIQTDFEYYTSGTNMGLLHKEKVALDQNRWLETLYEYDSVGNILKKSTQGYDGYDGAGTLQTRYTRWEYDAQGRYQDKTFVQTGTPQVDDWGVVGEALTQEVVSRNNLGQVTKSKDSYGVVTTFNYGTFGRLNHSYVDTGSWESVYYENGHSSCPTGTAYTQYKWVNDEQFFRSCFDTAGRVTRSIKRGFSAGELIYQDTKYDNSSRVKFQSVPYFSTDTVFNWTEQVYDRLGRVTETFLPVSSSQDPSTRIEYDGLDTFYFDTNGNKKKETKNALGQLIDVKDDLDVHIYYKYDAAGHLIETDRVSGTAHNVISIKVNKLGQKTEMTDPDKGTWQYYHNDFGELVEQLDAKNQKIEMDYDVMGRMVKRTEYVWLSGAFEKTNESTWVYDYEPSLGAYGVGRQLQLSSTLSQNFDPSNGNPTTSEGFLYTFDGSGRQVETFAKYDQDVNHISIEKVTYDEHGRVFQVFDATGNDRGIENVYNSRGFLEKVYDSYYTNANARTVYVNISEMDEYLNVDSEYYGFVPVSRDFDELGRVREIDALGVIGHENTYYWSYSGNLYSRQSEFDSQGQSYHEKESFCYDVLNRLVKVDYGSIVAQCSGVDHTNGDIRYSGSGNITQKDGRAYSYGANGAGPHAVTNDGVNSYTYDANGNMLTGKGRTLVYNAANQLTSAGIGNFSTGSFAVFQYGINRQRYQRKDTVAGVTKTTRYYGNVEVIYNGDIDTLGVDSARTVKRYIGGHALVTHDLNASGAIQSSDVQFLLKDHLGSTIAIINQTNSTYEQMMSFDPWGQRRPHTNWSQKLSLINPSFDVSNTTRGYTGHEMVDALGFIHMNGRIYDPELGRFMQADPVVDGVTTTQGFNRYSYVQNNPLNATDPSGYSAWTDFRDGFIKPLAKAATMGIAYFACGQGASGAACAGSVGAAWDSTEVKLETGSWYGALRAGTVAGVSAFATASLLGPGISEGAAFLTGGAIGGLASMAAGGKFGHGFFSAGIGAAIGASGIFDGVHVFPASIANGIIGGTLSVLSGGKFANGAASAAFSFAVSSAMSGKKPIDPHEYEGDSYVDYMQDSYGADVYAVADTVIDAGMIVYDVGSLVFNVATGDWIGATTDLAALGADFGCAAIPGATGCGMAVRASRGLGNPFANKSASQIDQMFKAKGYRESGTNPQSGMGGYVNPKTGRSYHIDPKEYGKYQEPNHVDVNRPRGYKGPLDKKKYPYK